MTPEQFCYWLQGRLEDRDLVTQSLTLEEQNLIKQHLALVFDKVTALKEKKVFHYPYAGVPPSLLC